MRKLKRPGTLISEKISMLTVSHVPRLVAVANDSTIASQHLTAWETTRERESDESTLLTHSTCSLTSDERRNYLCTCTRLTPGSLYPLLAWATARIHLENQVLYDIVFLLETFLQTCDHVQELMEQPTCAACKKPAVQRCSRCKSEW